ncbi:MAG: hypothetical protein ACRD1G_02670 [Acidimicrobiales bacterium]
MTGETTPLVYGDLALGLLEGHGGVIQRLVDTLDDKQLGNSAPFCDVLAGKARYLEHHLHLSQECRDEGRHDENHRRHAQRGPLDPPRRG